MRQRPLLSPLLPGRRSLMAQKRYMPMSRADLDTYFRTHRPHPPLAVKEGDRVCYTRYFLLSIGVSATDPLWRAEGFVVNTSRVAGDVAHVVWDRDVQWGDREKTFEQLRALDPFFDERTPVNTGNLAFVGPNLRRCE